MSCSYEFLRRSLIFYRNEIQKITGKVSESLQGTSQVVTDVWMAAGAGPAQAVGGKEIPDLRELWSP